MATVAAKSEALANEPASNPSPRRHAIAGFFADNPWIGPLLAIVLLAGLLTVTLGGRFLNPEMLRLILVDATLIGVAAIGMTLVLIAGEIDLSVGSSVALTGVAIALISLAGVPPVLAAALGVAMAVACGLLIGAYVVLLGVSSFIVTLGALGILRGAALGLAGEASINVPNSPLVALMSRPDGDLAWLVLPAGCWLMLILAAVAMLAVRYLAVGRHLIAVGSNRQTARLCGVRVDAVRVAVFAIAGLTFGLAGLLNFSYISATGDPTASEGMELKVIAAVVIGGASLAGGRGSIAGSVLGAILIALINAGCVMMGWDSWVQTIVTGVIIVIAVTLDRLRAR